MSHIPTVYMNSVHVKDSFGGISHTIFDEWSDDIYIAVTDAEGYNLVYSGEAKHLRDWCKHWKLQLRHQILEIEIENPFDLED